MWERTRDQVLECDPQVVTAKTRALRAGDVTEEAIRECERVRRTGTVHSLLLSFSLFSSSLRAARLCCFGRKMRLPLALLLVIQSVLAVRPAKRHYTTHDYYVIEHNPLAGASLAECAGALGVEIVEQAGELADHWLVRVPKGLHARDSAVGADPVLRALETIRREANAPRFLARSDDALRSRRISTAVRHVLPQTLRQRVKRAPPPIRPPPEDIETSEHTAQRLGIHDPEFGKQWHLVNDEFPEHMMNVTPVWEMGFTGQGVITALVDDGLDYTSDDLAANFVSVTLHLGLRTLC